MSESAQQQIFQTWLSEHKGLLFKIIRAYTRTATDRDDLFQEIALQVWRSIPSFRQESAVTTWLYRISLNTAIRWVKNERKHTQATPIENVQHILRDNPVSNDDRLTWLYTEIYKLDEIDRSIFILMIDGLSYKEMADILGITQTHVGVKINRIKKQLITKSSQYDHGI